jgi:hypothetical protein
VRLSRPLVSGFLVAATMAGCAATSHLSGVQPPRPRAVTRTASERALGLPTASWTRAPKYQRGLDVDFYNWKGLNTQQSAASDVAYIKSLHGNAMSISFPFFMHGWYAKGVYGNGETPSPAQLAIVAKDASNAGLYFSIRPLLDESSLHHKGGRTHWTPSNAAAWFASYEKFLKPYAQMAQQVRLPELIIGVEFDKINNSPYWGKLATYLRRYYKGRLSYSNNWEIAIKKSVSSAGVAQSLDAYPPMRLRASASQAQITASWDSYLKSKARGIVVSEIGIASQDGAYTKPYSLNWHEPLDPRIQTRWFTAACDAVVKEKDAGIYFWSVLFDQGYTSPPTTSDPTSFVDGPGAAAHSACFKRLS